MLYKPGTAAAYAGKNGSGSWYFGLLTSIVHAVPYESAPMSGVRQPKPIVSQPLSLPVAINLIPFGKPHSLAIPSDNRPITSPGLTTRGSIR